MSERRYGCWAGFPQGHPEDKTRCIEKIWPNERGAISRQCGRKRGFGPDGLYCKQHDPAAVTAKADAQEAKYKAKSAQRYREWTDQFVGARLRERDPELYKELAGGVPM